MSQLAQSTLKNVQLFLHWFKHKMKKKKKAYNDYTVSPQYPSQVTGLD